MSKAGAQSRWAVRLIAMQQLEPQATIHLLPLFDAYTLGLGRDVEPLLAQVYKRLVFRPAGLDLRPSFSSTALSGCLAAHHPAR